MTAARARVSPAGALPDAPAAEEQCTVFWPEVVRCQAARLVRSVPRLAGQTHHRGVRSLGYVLFSAVGGCARTLGNSVCLVVHERHLFCREPVQIEHHSICLPFRSL